MAYQVDIIVIVIQGEDPEVSRKEIPEKMQLESFRGSAGDIFKISPHCAGTMIEIYFCACQVFPDKAAGNHHSR